MRKIAIVTRKMVAGGIEKSIISMINTLPKDMYDITLFVMAKGGEFEKNIPDYVKIKPIYGSETTTKEKIINNIKSGKIVNAIKIIFYTILSRNAKSVFDQEQYYLKLVEEQNEEYDLAIADHVPASLPVVYVSENLKAKRKVAWIHSDVLRYKKQLNRYIKYYEKYDKIFSVSKEAMENLKNMYPQISDKVDLFYNIISKEELNDLARVGQGFEDKFDGVKLLTIGRLCEEKGQILIPEVVKNLVKDGYDFRWYCIGDGEDRGLLENKICEEGLTDYIKLLGRKNNPYKYLEECDIYIQPSKYECYCTTVTEAKCFFKPMVITNVNGSNEQIKHGQDGIIVEFDTTEIYRGIKLLLDDKNIRKKFENNLKNTVVDTRKEINKIVDLMI